MLDIILIGMVPGLMVMEGNSWVSGCEFEFEHLILLDDWFFSLICSKIVFMFETTKNKQKEVGYGKHLQL